jgi:hypothetical protein
MTTADLNALRTDLATRSKWNIGYFVAGLLFWVYVTAVAFLLPLATARFYWLAGTFVIFPVAVFVSWLLRADPFSKGNALGELVGYTHMSVAAMTFPLVMLALVFMPEALLLVMAIAYCLDFYVMSWAFGTPLFGIHAAVRTVLVSVLWFAWPEGRLFAVPLTVALAYLITILLSIYLRGRWLARAGGPELSSAA